MPQTYELQLTFKISSTRNLALSKIIQNAEKLITTLSDNLIDEFADEHTTISEVQLTSVSNITQENKPPL